MQLLEQQGTALVKDFLAFLAALDLFFEFDHACLVARNARVRRILGQTESALKSAGDGTADKTGHAVDFRIFKRCDLDFVVGRQEFENRADFTDRTAIVRKGRNAKQGEEEGGRQEKFHENTFVGREVYFVASAAPPDQEAFGSYWLILLGKTVGNANL